MKTTTIAARAIFAMAIVVSVTLLDSCKKGEDATPINQDNQNAPDASELKCQNPNSLVYPVHSRVFGRSYSEWAKHFFNWQYAFDCAHFPYYDQTGALQNQNQKGPIFFLGGAPLKPVPNTTNREVTVPRNAALFVPLIYYYANDCAAAPGGDLTANATGFSALMDQLTLSIDGAQVDVHDFLTTTPIFNYTANADLANCTGDLCFDGQQHPVVMSGYWVILKKLKHGTHTIHTTGGASAVFPMLKDVVWTIHQQ